MYYFEISQETVIAYTRTDSEAAEERVVDAALATQAASQDQDMDAEGGEEQWLDGTAAAGSAPKAGGGKKKKGSKKKK